MESQANETLEIDCHMHLATTEAQLFGEYHTNSTAKFSLSNKCLRLTGNNSY